MYHDLFPSSLSDEELANVSFPSATTPPSSELYPEVSDTVPHPTGVTVTHTVLQQEHQMWCDNL